jgi:hypothetical protein
LRTACDTQDPCLHPVAIRVCTRKLPTNDLGYDDAHSFHAAHHPIESLCSTICYRSQNTLLFIRLS